MEQKQLTFALFFGNRFVFSPAFIKDARRELAEAVEKAGHACLIANESMTRYGAVETIQEARLYADWLAANRGRYDGVILCMPNFSDETGAAVALRDAGVPILVQAYPDKLDKMDTAHRRDSFCGKFSIQDVFNQYKIPFTVFPPHCAHPLGPEFARNLRDFAAVCRVANGMKRFTLGAFGARTTKFKTVRFDETTLEKYGITVEAFDLSEVFARVDALPDDAPEVVQKADELKAYVACAPRTAGIRTLAKFAVILDRYIGEYGLNAIAFRCWSELGDRYGVSICPVMSMLNEKGLAASCEVDVCTAVGMYALQLATGKPAACLDWNNNYGADENKCILFHCGPVPKSLMKPGGSLVPNQLSGGNIGCYVGDIAEFTMTFSGCKTENGVLSFYMGEGEITGDPVDKAFFGAKGVAHIPNLSKKLIAMGRNSFRHHVALGCGRVQDILAEAFTTYLGYDIVDIG
ncbi:fucose isomerase [Clostridia bacterium]|nr:fucose isomerase [Clostridia bacterium]